MKQSLREARALLAHQKHRRRHNRAERVEDALAASLAHAADRREIHGLRRIGAHNRLKDVIESA